MEDNKRIEDMMIRFDEYVIGKLKTAIINGCDCDDHVRLAEVSSLAAMDFIHDNVSDVVYARLRDIMLKDSDTMDAIAIHAFLYSKVLGSTYRGIREIMEEE